MSETVGIHTRKFTGNPEPVRSSIASVVGRVTYSIDNNMSPGDVAELRRLTTSDPASPAFFKLMASTVDPDQKLPPGGHIRDEIERKWAVFFQVAAMMRQLHSQDVSLGYALSSAGYSELRFVRLLRARGSLLYREVHTCAHFLAAKVQPCNLVYIARLIMVFDKDSAESIRRAIARNFYQNETRSKKES